MRWRVIVPAAMNGGKYGRRYFTGKGAEKRAKAHAAMLEAMRLKAGARLLSRPHEQQVAILHAADAMGERVMELPEAARIYMGTKVLLSVPVTQAVAECLAEKAKGNLSLRYMRGIRATLERFSLGKEKTPIDEIGTNQIEDFINRLAASASRRSQLIDLRTLFSFAVRRGYARANVASLVGMPQRDELEPGILTVQEARATLGGVYSEHPDCLRYTILVLFGGARPEEARLMNEKMVKARQDGETLINFGLIDIPASISKTNRRRLIETNPTFQAWWSLGVGELPLPEWKARKVRGFVSPWPHDGLRHSFVSYHSALHGEVATSTAAGHSIAVMHRHYKAAVTKDSARQFFGLSPNLVLGLRFGPIDQ